jgi:hypothetical protein
VEALLDYSADSGKRQIGANNDRLHIVATDQGRQIVDRTQVFVVRCVAGGNISCHPVIPAWGGNSPLKASRGEWRSD